MKPVLLSSSRTETRCTLSFEKKQVCVEFCWKLLDAMELSWEKPWKVFQEDDEKGEYHTRNIEDIVDELFHFDGPGKQLQVFVGSMKVITVFSGSTEENARFMAFVERHTTWAE